MFLQTFFLIFPPKLNISQWLGRILKFSVLITGKCMSVKKLKFSIFEQNYPLGSYHPFHLQTEDNYLRCFARFNTICIIWKTWSWSLKPCTKACNFTNINTSVFYIFKIVQMVPNRANHHIYSTHFSATLFPANKKGMRNYVTTQTSVIWDVFCAIWYHLYNFKKWKTPMAEC